MDLKKQFSHYCEHCNYKVVMVGDYGVGKTTLFRRIKADKPFQRTERNSETSNVGSCSQQYTDSIDFCTKSFEMESGKTVQVNFWDTGGAERFRSITRNYYTAANGVLLVYDATDPASLTHLRSWIEDAERYTHSATYFLLGNKYESPPGTYQVNELSEAFAVHKGITSHFKISAWHIDDDTLDQILQKIARELHTKAERRFASTSRKEQTVTCSLARDTVSLLPGPAVKDRTEKTSCCLRR